MNNESFPILRAMVRKEMLQGIDIGVRKECETLLQQYDALIEDGNDIRAGEVAQLSEALEDLRKKIYSRPLNDEQLKIISARYPEEFQTQINELLNQGNWRVLQTEMSVTDHHYVAMLAKRQPQTIPGFKDHPFWDSDVKTESTEEVSWISKLKKMLSGW